MRSKRVGTEKNVSPICFVVCAERRWSYPIPFHKKKANEESVIITAQRICEKMYHSTNMFKLNDLCDYSFIHSFIHS